MTVTASSLNVRKLPSAQASIIGSLTHNDIVDVLGFSVDGLWVNVAKNALTGWSSRKFLLPIAETPPPPGASIQPILDFAINSPMMRYSWGNNQGIAPAGYTKGMALAWARLYAKFKAGRPSALLASVADTEDPSHDALSRLADIFDAAGLDNESDGVDTLRHTVVLLMGLGMMESSGRFCLGRYMHDPFNTADSAEAGMFQASFDVARRQDYADKSIPDTLVALTNAYSAAGDTGFLDVFKEGAKCAAADAKNWGNDGEPGKEFQRLSKQCPAFAVEFAAIGVRYHRRTWAPINKRQVEISKAADTYLRQVQQIVDDQNLFGVVIGTA